MPESTTEEPSISTKSNTSAYLVCEGAECTCTGSSTQLKLKLKVTSHKKAYINDNKLVATEKDITFDTPENFGTCSFKPINNSNCKPLVQQWIKVYKDIEVEDHKVLTDQSQLPCTINPAAIITISHHGQTQEVSAEQAANIDQTIAVQVNALADIGFVKIPDKTVKVNSITGTIVEEEKFETVNKTEAIKSEKKNKPKEIFVRPGQAVEFTAAFEGTEALVCWRFNENKMNKYFLQHGSVYEARFAHVGKYTIEGYGTAQDTNFDVETQLNSKGVEITRVEDVSCSLDIIVKENKLIALRHENSGNIVDIKLSNKSNEVHVRLGVPAVFEAVFDMPPTKSEVEHLMLVLKDAGGNELKRTKGELKMVFEAKNSAADYSLEASFDNSDEKPIVCPIKTSLNTVSIVAATGAGNKEYDNVRPGTPIIFNVAKTKFTDDTIALELIESEESLIKWYENSEISVASGPTYSKVYHDEGVYTVRCNVSERKPGWFSMNTDTPDDWHFVVTRNYPTAIEQKSAGIVKVGKLITFEMKSIFNTNVFERKTIHWKLSGPQTDSDEGKTFYSFIPSAKGEYVVSATMNGETIEKKIECIECEITDAWWTDADGNMLTGSDAESNPSNTIGFAGWGQEVSAAFNHVGLNGEKVKIEVWQLHDSTHVQLHTTHTTVPDTNNGVVHSFKITNTMKGKIQEGFLNSNNNGNLYFKIVSESGLKIKNNGAALPFNPEKYLQVDSRVRVRAYFADNNDTTRYCTADLNTPVFLQVKSTNLINTELDVQFYRSIKNDENNEDVDYKSIGKKHTFKVEKDGMKSIKIDLNAFKDLLQKPTDSLSIFATISTTSYSDEKYSTQNRYMLTLYKALATNPVSKGTTKAFVTVGGSEGGSKGVKNCKNCSKNITLEDIKSICVDVNGKCMVKDDKMIIEALPYLNKYLSIVRIDTCLRKSHFLAQLAHESNFYILKESFIYKVSALLTKGVFKNTKEGLKNASLWGYSKSSSEVTIEDQENIASWMYQGDGKDNHNGGPESKDGWRYCGRGFKQITWKENYINISKQFNEFIKLSGDEKVDWETNYEKLTTNSRDAILSALSFWDLKKINNQADSGKDLEAVKSVTKVINGKDNGLEERKRFFDIAIKKMKVDDCKRIYNIKKDIFKTFDNAYKADKKTAYINVIVPDNRRYEGILILFDDTGVLFSCYCLCKGVGGSNQLNEYADTPVGLWTTSYLKDMHYGDLMYGNYGMIYLTGETGKALESKNKKVPRTGIAIHCGHTTGWDKTNGGDVISDEGYLMMTKGCVRVYNSDMKTLTEKYSELNDKGKDIKVYVENVRDITLVHDFYNLVRDPKEPGIKEPKIQTTQ